MDVDVVVEGGVFRGGFRGRKCGGRGVVVADVVVEGFVAVDVVIVGAGAVAVVVVVLVVGAGCGGTGLVVASELSSESVSAFVVPLESEP